MTKYYRVRTQEQWDWLADKLNIYCVKSMICPVIIGHEQGQKDYDVIQYYGGFEPIIEVSDLMEDERMEDYVTIKSKDLNKLHWNVIDGVGTFTAKDINDDEFAREQFLPADLCIPKSLLYPKVRMSEAEKKEFDQLDKDLSLIEALNEIQDNYGALSKRIYSHTTESIKEFEFEFARAWADPSLIEVIPEKKYWVKVPPTNDSYYFKNEIDGVEYLTTISFKPFDSKGGQFTQAEIEHHGLDKDIFKKVEVGDVEEN